MKNVKMRVRVYSDCEVRNPIRYFNSTFGNFSPFWKLLESDHPNCILCETENEFEYNGDEELGRVYDRITPVMYTSTKRSFVRC